MKCYTVMLLFDSPTISYAQAKMQTDGRWLVYERIVCGDQQAALDYFKDLQTRPPAPLTIEVKIVAEHEYPNGVIAPIDGLRWCSSIFDSPYAAAVTRFDEAVKA